jgi:diguanylate cyclase (GGDEF)-like protein/PAS domain S-box-containing protein
VRWPDGSDHWVSSVGQVRRDPAGRALRLVAVMQEITARKLAQQALVDSERRFRTLAAAAPLGIFRTDAAGNCLFVNERWCEYAGISMRQAAVRAWSHALHEDDRERIARELALAVENGRDLVTDCRFVSPEGHITALACRLTALRGESGEVQGYVGTVADISERKQMEQELFAEKERHRTTLASIADGVITTDANNLVTYLNQAAQALTGWPSAEALGLPFGQIYRAFDRYTGQPLPEASRACIAKGEAVRSPAGAVLVNRQGEERRIEDSVTPTRDGAGAVAGCTVVFRDVSRQHQQALELTRQRDILTGLMTAQELEARVKDLLDADNPQDCHALLCVDVDRLNSVNEGYGTKAGDALLRAVGLSLQSNIRKHDSVARMDSDEFAILLEKCPAEQARNVAEKLRRAIRDLRVPWQDQTLTASVSIGVVALTPGVDSVAQAFRAGHTASGTAGAEGGNRVQLFGPDDAAHGPATGDLLWLPRIQNALKDDRLRLFGQPIRPLDHTKGALFEILVRMLDETQQEVFPPGAFLPAAARYHLAADIDRWVLQHASRWIASVASDEPRLYAINLSGQSLADDEFLAFVCSILEQAGIDPRRICFDISEAAVLANPRHALRVIATAKERGCKLALDNFGSGPTSLGHMRQLHVDYVKIDGSLIRDIATHPAQHAMVKAIHQIAKAEGLMTVAQSVERPELIPALREIGVDYLQGHAIAVAAPLDQFAQPVS